MRAAVRSIRQAQRLRRVRAGGAWIADRTVEVDTDSTIARHARVAHHASLRASNIGEYTSIGRYSKLAFVDAGRFCSIAWDCTVGAVSHPLDHVTSHAFPYAPEAGGFVGTRNQTIQRTTLGSDVWIATHAVVMPDVTIGHGAAVAAAAVVTKNVEPYSIVAGVPARPIGRRFDDAIADRLLSLGWWNWPRDVLSANIALFTGPVDDETLDHLEAVGADLEPQVTGKASFPVGVR